MGKQQPLSSRERVARRRAKLRAQGLRLKQIWVPDTRAPGFWEKVQAETAAIAESEREEADQAFIDSISEWDDLPPDGAPVRD